jgi:hypothetical protein
MKRFFLLFMTLLISGLWTELRAQADDTDDRAHSEKESSDEAAKKKLQLVQEKMRYFQSHIGLWEGTQKYHSLFNDEKSESLDKWEGYFSLNRTHFEMDGEGREGEKKTTYKWVVTYLTDEEVFRAWYFDSNGNRSEYEIEWDADEDTMVWTTSDEENGIESSFTLKVSGEEINGAGKSLRADNGEILATQKIKYKKKSVSI